MFLCLCLLSIRGGSREEQLMTARQSTTEVQIVHWYNLFRVTVQKEVMECKLKHVIALIKGANALSSLALLYCDLFPTHHV